MCCSSIIPLVKSISEPVQNISTGNKCFNLGQFDLFFLLLFLRQKISLAPSIFSSFSLFSSSPLYLPHLLFPPCCPNIPAPILVSLEPKTFGFPLDSCPDALPVSHTPKKKSKGGGGGGEWSKSKLRIEN